MFAFFPWMPLLLQPQIDLCLHRKVNYRALFGESQHSEALPIVLVLHLFLIDLGEGNNVTSITKTWEAEKSELKRSPELRVQPAFVGECNNKKSK